jgi:hypothetical protein
MGAVEELERGADRISGAPACGGDGIPDLADALVGILPSLPPQIMIDFLLFFFPQVVRSIFGLYFVPSRSKRVHEIC